MSFVITVYVPEGIVMAADSRLSLNRTTQQGEQTIILQQFESSNSSQKLFLLKNKIGLSTCGNAAINNKPIAGYIDQFIEEKITDSTEVSNVPALLNEFFAERYNNPAINFHVAGFQTENNISVPHVYTCNMANSQYPRVNIDQSGVVDFGCAWSGESESISRLLKPCKILDPLNNWVDLPASGIAYNFFTLQDAIDFAIYAVKVTIDTMRFQSKPKTVGAPIDVLALRVGREPQWIQRKEYHGEK